METNIDLAAILRFDPRRSASSKKTEKEIISCTYTTGDPAPVCSSKLLPVIHDVPTRHASEA